MLILYRRADSKNFHDDFHFGLIFMFSCFVLFVCFGLFVGLFFVCLGFFLGGGCWKLLFWHIFGHNSRTTRHMEILIWSDILIPWLILHKISIFLWQNTLQFFSKTNKLENMVLPVSPIVKSKTVWWTNSWSQHTLVLTNINEYGKFKFTRVRSSPKTSYFLLLFCAKLHPTL